MDNRSGNWLTGRGPVRAAGGMLRTREGSSRDGAGILVLTGFVIGVVVAGILLAIFG